MGEPQMPSTPKSHPGRWLITSMPDFEDYLELGTERPVLMLKRSEHGSISGEYSFGLSTGEINGELREFGGEKILLFGYNGSDEMDESHGAGWARLAVIEPNCGCVWAEAPSGSRRLLSHCREASRSFKKASSVAGRSRCLYPRSVTQPTGLMGGQSAS